MQKYWAIPSGYTRLYCGLWGHMGASYYTYIIVYPSFICIVYGKVPGTEIESLPAKRITRDHILIHDPTAHDADDSPKRHPPCRPRPEGERDAA